MENCFKIKILIDGTTNKSIRSNLQIHFHQKDRQYLAKYDENTGLYFLDVTEEEGDLIVIDNGIEVYNNKIKPNEENTYFHFQLKKENEQIFKSEISTIYLCEYDKIGIVFDPNLKPLIEKELLLLGYQLHLKENRINNAYLKHFQDKNKQSWKEISLIKKIKGITHAGFTSCNENGNTFNLFEGEIYIQLSNNATIKSLKHDVDSLYLEHVSFDITDGIWHVITTEKTSYSLIELTHLLLQLNEVVNVWPVIYNEKILDEIIPNDFLWEGQWEKKLVHTQYAWQLLDNNGFHMFGSPGITMVIVDTGIASVLGVPENEDFQGNVSNGDTKVAWLFDFRPASFGPNNDTHEGSHGVAVAGMAAAKANDVSPNPFIGQGVVGSAPNIRLTGVQFDGYNSIPTFLDTLTRYRWMAGLVNYVGQTPHPNDPLKLNKGVDIIVSSIGSRMYGTPTVSCINSFSKMLDDLKHYGRQGRGILMFYSAGNDDKNSDPPVAGNSEVRYSSFAQVFACAASTINQSGNEDRARYSNYSNSNLHPEKKLIDFCAPSGSISESDFVQSKRDNIHNPPNTFLTWTTDKVGEGNLPGYNDTSLTTELTSAISAYEYNDLLGEDLEPKAIASGNIINPVSFGSSSFEVNNASVFTNYKWIKIETSSTTEWVIISSVDVPNNIINLASPITNNYLAGQPVSGYPYVSVMDSSGFFEGQYISIQSTPAEDKDIVQIQHIDSINNELVTSEISHSHSIIAYTSYGIFGLISVNVLTTNNLVEGKSILIGEVGYDDVLKKEKSDYEPVQKIINSTQFLVDRIRNSHSSGTKVYVGNLNYRNTFSGTSSAAPLCGGIGALVLSANPDLTWYEVRYILRKTAVKIDPDNIGFTVDGPSGNQDRVTGELGLGRWMDENGEYVLKIDGAPNPLSTGNRIYSDWYGYGRLNAEDAVQLALNYDENWLDLMIRDTLTDEGTTDNIGTIHSPDIWIQHTEVDYTNTSSNPKPDFSKAPPHENPKTNSDRYIYARVKNKGELLNNLECTIRFYIALCDGTNATGIDSPFLFPDDWSDVNPINDITLNSGSKKTYFLGEKKINSGEINPSDNDFFANDDSNFIVSVPWDSSFNPPLSTPLKTYLLVQVSPHDGNRNGLGAESNSNLSFREIAFANFEINNGGDTGSLQEEINVDEFGSQVVTDFTVNVGVDIGNFRTEKVVVELIREDSLGVHSKASFSHGGTNWELLDENNNTPTWANMTKPVLTGSSTPATGEQTEITFENASFYISKLYRKLFIKVIMNSSSSTSTIDIPIAEEIHEINIIEPALESKGLSFGAPPLFPKSYAFADMENLTQIQDHAFGPKSGNETNVFRVTSRFTATVDTSAYAIVKGKMMVQPGDVAGIVNLILKPFTQPIPGFTPIKYIIYRGLKESNFINTSNSTEVTPKDPSNSEWITELYNIHESQNGSGSTFLSKAIGYDATINGNTSIDKEFFKVDSDFQLPMAFRGIQLGEFDINHTFGIDIILEEGEFTPDFDFVRSEFEEIDISEIGNAFLNKLEREKILNFIDPAAFYGLHVKKNGLVEYRDSSNNTVDKKEQEIYDDIVEKFYTKNTTYVDIRNELGNSYNFFEHYNDGSIDEFNIQVKTDPFDDFILKKYGTNGWPILILNSISLTTTNETHDFSFKLRADENPKPILYIEHGGLQDLTKAEGGRFVEGDNLLQTGNLETEELTFEQPNTNDPDIVFNKLNISWLLKLHYSRQIDSSVNWTSIPKAVKTESYLDNVFGPVNLDIIPWNTDNNIKWIGIQDKKYIDASVNDFGYVAERGVAVEDTAAPEGGRVILYASALDSFKTPDLFPPVNGLTGGTSKKASFFEEAMSFAGYRLFFDVIDDAGTPITSLKLEPKTVESAPAQAMMILGLSRPEFDILKALTGLSNDYPATAFLEKIGSGSNFIKYKVGMQGLDTNGEYANVFPSTDIEVYSTDGLLFFTKKFSENEPLPTVYIRNAEEHIGIGDRTPMIFPVVLKNVDIGISTLIINKDIVKWIPPGDIIKVKDNTGTFHQLTVSNSSLNGVGQTELVVSGNIASLKENDSLFLTEKSWEDHIIDLDRSGSSGVFIGTDEMKDIVNSYATAVDNVINDLNAHLNLEAIVNNYASQIFDRALLLVKNDTLDDRILYWTRVKMEVILKSHEFMLQSFSSRNELIKLFEERSRGYNPDFTSPPVGTTKLILITGFDPFQLFPLEDRSQQNPSGAAALKLHGETITDGTEIAYIQAVVFPVRYKDFDDSVVEQVVEPFIPSSASPKVDMIMSLSLNGSKYYFDLERFAGRYRGGFHDNSSFTNVRPKSIGSNDSSNEFYETSLPVNKIITGPFNLTNQKIFYDQSYLTHGGTSQNHPTAMGPNTNTDIGSMPTGLAKEGSGSNYLSNEVFYRIARSRNNLNIVLSTGHYHLANPHPGFIPFGISAFTIEQILDEVEDAVRRSLNAI